VQEQRGLVQQSASGIHALDDNAARDLESRSLLPARIAPEEDSSGFTERRSLSSRALKSPERLLD